MKCASIDIGTNTVLLLIAEAGTRVDDIADISTIVRLGEGVKETGNLSREAMDRTLAALDEYAGIMKEHSVEKIICVGTSALREAANSKDFIAIAEEKLGIPVRIISERDEAYYTYLSVRNDEAIGSGNYMIVDIGGGSTEIIRGDSISFTDFVSLPAGSGKLTEMFVRSDPPADEEMHAAAGYVRSLMDGCFPMQEGRLVATGGTATTLASIALGLEEFDKKKIHGFSIHYETVCGIIERMRRLKAADRKVIKGMEKGRETILLQGAVLLREIMLCGHADRCVVSTAGVRYGVIHEYLAGKDMG